MRKNLLYSEYTQSKRPYNYGWRYPIIRYPYTRPGILSGTRYLGNELPDNGSPSCNPWLPWWHLMVD